MQENTHLEDTIRIDSDNEGNIFYIIPQRYRKMENLHIVFWLFKDISWCMLWKPLGILMVFPTLLIAVIISWRTRNKVSELCHNLAIVLWISANSYWMISEFLKFDSLPIVGNIHYKHLALIPFVLGILILGWYYLWYSSNEKRKISIQPAFQTFFPIKQAALIFVTGWLREAVTAEWRDTTMLIKEVKPVKKNLFQAFTTMCIFSGVALLYF